MNLRYIKNPAIDPEELAALRTAVGWDARKESIEKTAGKTYMNAACYDGDRLIGFVDVISDAVEDALIRNLIVHPDYRRRGVALELLRIVVEKIKADRIKTTNVLFEPEHTDLYRKAGFRIIKGGLIDNENEKEGH